MLSSNKRICIVLPTEHLQAQRYIVTRDSMHEECMSIHMAKCLDVSFLNVGIWLIILAYSKRGYLLHRFPFDSTRPQLCNNANKVFCSIRSSFLSMDNLNFGFLDIV